MSASRSSEEADPARQPRESGDDPSTRRAIEQGKAALENVREGYEKAPPGAAGEPSWPTGGNIKEGPRSTQDDKR